MNAGTQSRDPQPDAVRQGLAALDHYIRSQQSARVMKRPIASAAIISMMIDDENQMGFGTLARFIDGQRRSDSSPSQA